jgi:hypothetical protein
MTRLRLRTLARKRLGETTASFWPDSELNDWLNDAGDDVAEKTKCLKSTENMTTIEDQAEYVPSTEFPGYLSIDEIYLYRDGKKWERLEKKDRKRLTLENPAWKSVDASTPQYYYWDEELDVLGFYPKPNEDNAGTDYVEAYLSIGFTAMTQDTETPVITSKNLRLAMVDYVVATGYESRGWGDKANDAWGKYFKRVHNYLVGRDTEENDDDEGIVMKNYRNV